ncbi:MAG: FAD-dependent oxidoreductase, partial [bacterium]|nr:FAD-dependent oxidoreductase [bacterium]
MVNERNERNERDDLLRKTVGSVMVVGGGIAGMQASLDLAESGFKVYLVEDSPAIGGKMAQLDKTFPTNDCSMCILSPKLVDCGKNLNIELLTLSEVKGVSGEKGNFTVTVAKHPKYVDWDKCVGCGICAEKCPTKVTDEFNLGLSDRKAIYVKYPQAVPLKYAIDDKSCLRLSKDKKCGLCEKFCEAKAINLEQQEEEVDINVGSIIMASGFKPFDPHVYDTYGYGKYPNVVTSMEFERFLSASGPDEGHLLKPSNKKPPKKIAWLQCIGSRDQNRCDHKYCSSVCCTYAIKEAIIAKEHAHGELETTIFFMDMRTAGKDFERYYNRAQQEYGVRFVRSRIHTIDPISDENDNLRLVFADEDGKIRQEEFDMVVLSVGLEPDRGAQELAQRIGIELNGHGFSKTSGFEPVNTSKEGVFVCGALQGPKDIPSSVMEASAAACRAANMLSESRGTLVKTKEIPPEIDVAGQTPRIGVWVCSCGINIAGVVDVEAVRDYAATLPGVEYVENNLYTCSQDTQEKIKEVIKEKKLNRVVVASCTPRTHEPLFQNTCQEAGLNKYLFEMANVRDQCSWVHQNEREAATEKAKALVRSAVAKV